MSSMDLPVSWKKGRKEISELKETSTEIPQTKNGKRKNKY